MATNLRATIDEKVKAQYLERFENFINAYEDQLGEQQKVIEANEQVLKIVKKVPEKDQSPIIKESIEGFNQVIEMTKQNIDTINLKLTAAKRLVKKVKKDELVLVIDFLTDFDIVAGGGARQ